VNSRTISLKASKLATLKKNPSLSQKKASQERTNNYLGKDLTKMIVPLTVVDNKCNVYIIIERFIRSAL
jgi:hypothetical protein